jgi:DNA-binding CsgD family transcriptional regulator
VIIGRDHELEQLGGLVSSLESGPRVLLLEGEAGIGKTTIWEAGVELASAAPARVLAARAAQAEMPLAFASLADLLDDVRDELLPALPPPQRDALAVALMLAPPQGELPDARAIATAFLGGLRALAEEAPVVVAVDDAQWLDPPSAAALAFAVRRLRSAPVGFLLTLRTPSPLPLGLARSPPELAVERRVVGPMSLAALQRLLRTRLGEVLPRPALRRVHDAAGGNPFFALELARALSGRWRELGPGAPLPVPETLGVLLRERLAGLSPSTLELLLRAALRSDLSVSRLGDREALQPAIEAGVVTMRDGRLAFAHPLLASTLVEMSDPAGLRELHRELADDAESPEERSRHLALATDAPDEAIAAELTDAARIVASRGAPGTAADLAEQASRLTPAAAGETAASRAVDASQYAWAAGDAARAKSLLDGAQAHAHGRVRAQALVHLARLQIHAGDRRAAAAAYSQAAEQAGGDPALLAQVHEGLAWCLFLTREDVPSAAGHARRAVELADAVGDTVLLGDALSVQAQAEFFQGGGLPNAAIERALALVPEGTTDVRVLRQPRMHWAVLLQCADRLDEARDLLRHVHANAIETGDDSALPWVLMRLALVELLAGRWEDAAELAESGYELALDTYQRPLAAMLLCARGLVYAHQGRSDEARAAAGEGLTSAVPLGDGVGMSLGRWALGLAALGEGDPAAALGELEELNAVTERAGITEPGATHWIGDLVESLVDVGRLEEAAELTDRLADRGARLGRDWALAVAGRCRGLLAAAEGRVDEALDALEEAFARHASVPVPFDRARTLLALGVVRRRARRRRDAREALELACEEFERLGAARWLERGRAELARVGGRAPSDGDLTPSERRVAALVAEGRTNREVAAELVVTEKTVESHLSHVYRKLGVRSRAELAHRYQDD